MNCFNHPERPALGLCKSCGKGICGDCLAELENGLACRGRCEQRVNLINRIIDCNPKILEATRSQVRGVAVFLVVLGVPFLVLGGFSLARGRTAQGIFPLFVGIAFCMLAIWRSRAGARYPKLD